MSEANIFTPTDPSLDVLREVGERAAAEVVKDVVDQVVDRVIPGESPFRKPLKRLLRKVLLGAVYELVEAIIEAVMEADRKGAGADRIWRTVRAILDRNPQRMLERAEALEDLGKVERAQQLRAKAQQLLEAQQATP